MQELEEFLSFSGTIYDVRSPSEYAQGHIPGAVNLPLFTDDERCQVGTTYKKIGKQQAIDLGLGIVGPKLLSFVENVRKSQQGEYAKVHCWRGGMRSSSMAWLLKTAGIKTITLKGGYKTFRQWTLGTFEKKYNLKIIGGLTGSGKTAILHALRNHSEQILDLEGLANHRGSSFGVLGTQPTIEHFQNLLAHNLWQLHDSQPIWVEDESSLVGTCNIPKPFFEQMQQAPLWLIDRPIAARIDFLVKDYAHAPITDLISATLRISKRLGGVRTQQAIANIQSNNLHEATKIILEYYDKAYTLSLSQRPKAFKTIEANEKSATECAYLIQSMT